MNSSLIGKIEKAKRYAGERHRLRFKAFSVDLQGDNDSHCVSFDADGWVCSCDFFAGRGLCSHTMTLERILDGMLPREAFARSL